MKDDSTEEIVIGLLKRVISGEAISEHEVTALSGADFSVRAGQAWHQLAHWVSDEDIRCLDAEYASMQLDGLKRQLAALSAKV